jgi:hypothetical protein
MPLKTIKIFITNLLLGSALWAQGQTAPALEAAPPALSEPAPKPEGRVEKATGTPAPFIRKPQFSLAMGSQFSRYGHAAYLQPTVSVPLTQRLEAFASVQFLNSFGPAFYRTGSEVGSFGPGSRGQQAYLVMAGGNYAVNEKLQITGSIWRDLAHNSGMPQYPVHAFSPAGTQGMQFRAHYKVNDRFSVSGGLRYQNGSGNTGYNPLYYQGYNSPFGF